MISLGAGIYEELLFRVLLVGGARLGGAGGFRLGRGSRPAFSRPWSARSSSRPSTTSARTATAWSSARSRSGPMAGVLFSGLYLLRGFGITAWTHALYDVFLALWGGSG